MTGLWLAFGAANAGKLVLPPHPTPVPAEPFLDALALHLRLDGQVVDQVSLGARYDALCADGRELACSWRAWDDLGRVRPAELARLTDPICGKGDRVVCVAQAWALALGDGTWNGPAVDSAAARLTAACDHQVRRACTELGALAAARPIDAPEPLALHGYACALGEPVGCLRAAELAPSPAVAAAFRSRAGEPPWGEAGCAAGFVAACEEQVAHQTGPARLETLEQLCHRSEERWCPVLAEALDAGTSPPATEDDPDAVWFVDHAALLGWYGPTFQDHGLLPYAGLRWAELRQGDHAIADTLVLVGGDREWVTPIADCPGIVAAAERLSAGGVMIRALGEHLGPSRSLCLDGVGPGAPEYHGGRIGVDPRLPDDVAPATERKAKLDAASPELFACLGSATSGPEDPVVAAIVHRSGPPSRVKASGSSGDPAFDTCALAWLSATDLGTSDVTIKYTVTLDVW